MTQVTQHSSNLGAVYFKKLGTKLLSLRGKILSLIVSISTCPLDEGTTPNNE